MSDPLDIVNPESVGLSSVRLERLQRWLDHQISSGRLAGASVLVARHGRTAFFEAAGTADPATGRPFRRDTVVRIYSMTKPVTTAAAMMLYEEGAFQLDDPVARYLPEFAGQRVWAGGNAPIDDTQPLTAPMTVRQLMTHTSGLTYGFMQANAVDAAYRQAGIELPGGGGDLSDMVQRIAELPLICQPGSAWNYSVSTDVLGRLVEVWSGMTLAEFFAERIFAPLGMGETGFHVRPELADRFAACFQPEAGVNMSRVSAAAAVPAKGPQGLRLQDPASGSAFLEPTTLYSGGGGLTASMGDYARFCQMLLNGGELDGERVLGRTTVAYMRANQLPGGLDMAAMGQPVWSETSYDGIGFGLGFAVVLDPVKAHIVASPGEHHWGGAASTFFWLDPVENLYTVFFTQLMPSSTYPIRRELRVAVNQALID